MPSAHHPLAPRRGRAQQPRGDGAAGVTTVPRALALLLALGALAPATARAVDFSHDVVPVLRVHCAGCHAGAQRQGGFSINDREAILAGGDSGVAGMVPGKATESELIRRITSTDPDIRMPSDGEPLPAEAIDVLTAWVDGKAPWEDGFSFQGTTYEAPLALRPVALPPPQGDRQHPVDRIVDAYRAGKGVPTPPACDDATFIRRASLDLVGLLPTPERVAAFRADPDPGKRVRFVRELLDDDLARAEHWMTFWNDLLRNDYTGTGFITGGRKQITTWLHQALVDNLPYDRFVRGLVSPDPAARGFIDGIVWRGEVNSSQTVPIQFAQNVGQTFLGINLKCASCHDSFIDRWTLQQSYDLAAVLAPEPLELFRCDKATGARATPGWPFAELGQIDAAQPPAQRLARLAELLTDPGNGWLSRNLVNRVWARLMGRGLVHPVDALRTRPWNEDLLDWLAADLVAHGWDTKHLLETICTSAAYGAATPAVTGQPQGTDYVFHGPVPRRMTAEQFTDGVWQLTGQAPAKADADVVRVRPDPAAPRPLPSRAKWIWNNPSATSPPGEKLAFRTRIDLLDPVPHAVAVATADNEVTMWVNGTKVGHSADWGKPFAAPITGALKQGSNEILVVAANAAAGGPAALKAEVRAILAGGGVTWVASDDSWEWTASLPDAEGQWPGGTEPADWQKARVVEAQGTWASSDKAFAAGLAGQAGPQPMVRAALVKCTPLMAALGRPNRDQVVTSRPTDLTTLEAIQLANEQALFETFTKGATRWRTASGDDPAALTTAIFTAALSRSPTAGELAAAREMLGAEPNDQRVADLLWAVVMLPEFQFVR
ncbi:MAG: DUF1549 domain-containing protein [Planctomycetia bacterium]|nr:DUF1549 domain-containing protein [Planctomycetia bacterium]